jgi:hypothetical protein
MKEVTADGEILKSSVFHRLIQRAFPQWFPYDSIRFFHPFYTAEQNAKYAQAQGYGDDFRMKATPVTDFLGRTKDYKFDLTASEPSKPEKPLYLYKHDEIAAILSDTADDLVHPARLELHGLPSKIRQVLQPGNDKDTAKVVKGLLPVKDETPQDDTRLINYFLDLTHQIVAREFIVLKSGEPDKASKKAWPVYQVDITRE